MEESANKLHFKYTDFNSPTGVTVYSECTYVFVAEYHVNLLTSTAVMSAVMNFWWHKLIAKLNN